jgi:hypothetical protein
MGFDGDAVAQSDGRQGGVIRLGWAALALLLLLSVPGPSAAVEQLHIVSRWAGDVPHHIVFDGASFNGWHSIGGKTIISSPALVSYQGQVHLFGVSNDQKLYQAIWNGTSWSGWFDFGGPFASVAAVDYFGYLIVVAVTPDNRLLMTFFDPNAQKWQNYSELAINIFGRPAVALLNGVLHFMLRGSDENYYHWFYSNQFSNFINIGGPFAYGAALTTFQGVLHLFGPGFNGRLYESTLAGTQWSQFLDLGQPAPSLPIDSSAGAAGYAGIAIVVLARATDNGLYGRVFSNGAWGAWSANFGQGLSGPAITAHQVSGGGPGTNHPPTFSAIQASRLVHSFGREDSLRSEGIGGRPGVNGLAGLLTSQFGVSLNGGASNPLVTAAGGLMDCCTLIVAESPSDPDGNPILVQWQAVTGTFYSTGTAGSGGVPYGGKITDITTYNRNSVFWEAPSIGFPLVHHDLMGGLTNVGVKITDVPATGPPLSSDTKFVALEWDRTIHLELSAVSGRRLPQDDPDIPGGIEMQILPVVTGNSQNVGLLAGATVRIACGNRKDTIRSVPFAAGVPVDCPYEHDEENHSVTVGAVVTSGGTFISPPDGPKLDLWKSRGCTVGTTESIDVKLTTSECSTQTFPGGDAPETHLIEMGVNQGTFQFDWETYGLEDRIVVSYQGATLFDSGCVGANGSETLTYSGNATQVQVQVFPNCNGGTGTAWVFTVNCAE